MPPDYHALTLNEVQPAPDSFGQKSPYKHVQYYIQAWRNSDYSKDLLVEEKQHPYTGTTYTMGSDPKTSVVNQFQQSRDVKNHFVVDGASFASTLAQNPTWTILSLCWRSCDYLADQPRKGEI